MYEKRAPSAGTPSVYSHVTTRSSANLRSSRSVRSLKTPWYQKPIIHETYFLDVQRSSLIIAIYSLVRNFALHHKRRDNFNVWFVLCFTVAVDFHGGYSVFWFVLLCYGCTWFHTLWLLCDFVWVCLCWQQTW